MSQEGKDGVPAKTALVLGASANPERYSNKAVKALLDAGWSVFPANPSGGSVHGLSMLTDISQAPSPVHTLTVYVNPSVSSSISQKILALKPRRIVFNPGSENPSLAKACAESGIETLEACTLVMLRTGQF